MTALDPLPLGAIWPLGKWATATWGAAVFALDVWAIGRALSRGHGVQGTLAWVFSILAFPLLGACFFFLLASPGVKRIALRKRRASASLRRSLGAAAGSAASREPADQLIDLATSLTGLNPSAGNQVTLLSDDAPTFERLEAAIQSAQRALWVEYYIIRNDETGRRFLELLAERAAAGVEVRLLYDAVGSIRINAERLRAIVRAGGHARVFSPMNPLRRRWSVHLRNHRKVVVIDGHVGFTGGMNVGDEYSGRRKRFGLKSHRDSHLEIRGPAVHALAHAFAEDWSFATGEHLALPPRAEAVPGGTSVVAIVPSGPDQEHNASAMVHFSAMTSARKRLYVVSPYFIPDEATVSALVSAALRGVDVRVMVPRDTNILLATLAARAYYAMLLRGGVRIFEYEPTMMHSKILVGDGAFAVVGSANVDIRSYRLNFEIGALIVDPAFAASVEQRFFRDLANSRPVQLDMLAKLPRREHARYALAKLLSPIL